MGLFSSKSSSSSSTTTTYNTDNSALGADASGENARALVVRGDSNSIELLDQGAIESAFGFAERNASAYADATLKIIEQYGGVTKATSQAVSGLAQQNAADLRSFAIQQSQSESGRLADLVKVGILAVAVVMGARMFAPRRAT